MFDKFREECGVFGIHGHPEAANLTYLGLYALQHRGQESAGIAASDGVQIRHRKAMGYVNEAFDAGSLAGLTGNLAIGHVRYSTAGESKLSNAQPIVVDSVHGPFAIGHNGNLVNAGELRDELVRQGAFSFIMLTKDRVIGVRDPHGFRPLALGRLGDAWVMCSETCALDLIGATYIRDVEPGEVVIVSAQGLRSVKP